MHVNERHSEKKKLSVLCLSLTICETSWKGKSRDVCEGWGGGGGVKETTLCGRGMNTFLGSFKRLDWVVTAYLIFKYLACKLHAEVFSSGYWRHVGRPLGEEAPTL